MAEAPVADYTVMVPAFNAERFLLRTLESLARQDHPPDRLVVLDDGSTDGTVDIARGFGAEVCSLSHAGLPAVQNYGLGIVETRYVAFVDSDDLWFPFTGNLLCKALARTSASAVGARPRTFRDDAPPSVALMESFEERELGLNELSHRNMLTKSGTMFDVGSVRSLGGYNTSLPACEDWDLLLRMRSEGMKIVALDADGLALRLHSTSMSRDPAIMVRSELAVSLPYLAPEQRRGARRRIWLRAIARAAQDGRPLTEVPAAADIGQLDLVGKLISIPITKTPSLASRTWLWYSRWRNFCDSKRA